MAKSWDEYAADWDNEPSALLYADKAFESLQQIVDIQDLRVLDFGCGTGLLSQKLSPLV